LESVNIVFFNFIEILIDTSKAPTT